MPLRNDWTDHGDYFSAADQNDVANAVNQNTTDVAVASAALSGKVDTTRTISAGTGLTGGGDLSANRSLAVAYGSTAGTACQGNDSRLSDARTPTAHTHTTANVTGLDAALAGKIAGSGSAVGMWMGTTLPGSGTAGVLYVVPPS
ncbi:hypothetical protein A5731_00315 [Mycolicibacterium conceptionense]|uniref:hypothetical protein n=1 Tax=Mycolicibacterium TaxID=1866885 RepID=UPI0007E9C1C4|nr:hypothetical protein [Mycolicibacterium conceptionense]OBB15447.1 hypothetical protein A5718_29705 [Mycolicibacterium conceptionense]OBF09189.1 hypothetical protein A5731_00315 [Mycolicibacterium conceptionense]